MTRTNQIVPTSEGYTVEIAFTDLMNKRIPTTDTTIGRAVAQTIQDLLAEKVPSYRMQPDNGYKLKMEDDFVIVETKRI